MQLRSRFRFYRIAIRVACGSKDDELQAWRLEEKSVRRNCVSSKRLEARVGEPPCRKNHGEMVRLRRSVTGFSTIAASAGARPPASLLSRAPGYFTSTFRRIQGWMQH